MEQVYFLATDADIEGIVKRVVKRLTAEPAPVVTDKLLTSAEAMERLQITKPTLHRWRLTGVIPAIKLGGSFRYRESDIQKVIEKQLTV